MVDSVQLPHFALTFTLLASLYDLALSNRQISTPYPATMASAAPPGNVPAAAAAAAGNLSAGYAAPGEWEDFDDEQIKS